MDLITMVPDYKGAATKDASNPDGFFAKVRVLYPQALIVPVLNGQTTEGLKEIGDNARRGLFAPILCSDTKRGMVGACMLGYSQLHRHYPDATIVKLDTAEHDISYIGEVARLAGEKGAAVAELDFSKSGLVEGTYDYWIHKEVFPAIYGAHTNGKLKLSCAHGFQAYCGDAARRALGIAKALVDEVERSTSVPMSWGFDAAMALGAVAQGIPLGHMTVPAQSVRNREVKKINDQLTKHSQLLAAANRLKFF